MSESLRPRAFQSIVYGGLVVGILDGLDAILFFGFVRGSRVDRIFQFIASGILGRDAAFSGGTKTLTLGVLLHFLNATIFAAIYHLVSRKFSALIRRPFIWGPLYGIAVHFVMQFVVTPLSAAPTTGRYPFSVFLNGVIGHALLVGLPIALINSRYARSRS